MDRAEEFRRQAEQAERDAAAAPSEAERTALRKVAEGFRELEAAARARQRPSS